MALHCIVIDFFESIYVDSWLPKLKLEINVEGKVNNVRSVVRSKTFADIKMEHMARGRPCG